MGISLTPILNAIINGHTSGTPVNTLSHSFKLSTTNGTRRNVTIVRNLQSTRINTTIGRCPKLNTMDNGASFAARNVLSAAAALSKTRTNTFSRTVAGTSPTVLVVSLTACRSVSPGGPTIFSSAVVSNRVHGILGCANIIVSSSVSTRTLDDCSMDRLKMGLIRTNNSVSYVNRASCMGPVISNLGRQTGSSPTFTSGIATTTAHMVTLGVGVKLT